MAYSISANDTTKINLAPGTVVEEVLQNLRMILSIPQFSVPLDRGFGLSQRFVDKPISVAQSIIVSELLDAIEKYEPRAEILNTTFEKDEKTGKLTPRLEVNIIG